jgi:hypothetical protein
VGVGACGLGSFLGGALLCWRASALVSGRGAGGSTAGPPTPACGAGDPCFAAGESSEERSNEAPSIAAWVIVAPPAPTAKATIGTSRLRALGRRTVYCMERFYRPLDGPSGTFVTPRVRPR